MTTTSQDFTMYAGTRVTVQITVSDADGSEAGHQRGH